MPISVRAMALILVLASLLTACGKSPPPSAVEVLAAMISEMERTAQPLPDGVTYHRAAPPDSPAYLTDSLLSALYGEAARGLLEEEDGFAAIGDGAVYLSLSAYPCELAVFRCADPATAATVLRLCRERMDTVARGYVGGEWEALAGRGQAEIAGGYVLLAIAEDPAAVLAAARRFLW
jgi:hypothetical protein